MKKQKEFNIREISEKDIDLIADYWLNSDSEFMLSMGVDLQKLPKREDIRQMLSEQIQLPDSKKASFALILEINGIASGHCNVNEIEYGKQAKAHMHIWDEKYRRKSYGSRMLWESIAVYFERLKLKRIVCEPFSQNMAPNKTLQKLGFEFVKRYRTVPGSLNFEQEVNHYVLSREKFEKKIKLHNLDQPK